MQHAKTTNKIAHHANERINSRIRERGSSSKISSASDGDLSAITNFHPVQLMRRLPWHQVVSSTTTERAASS